MRRGGILAIAAGAVLLIAAVAGFIIVPEHAPGFESIGVPAVGGGACPDGSPPILGGSPGAGESCTKTIATGLSQTTYDVLRITTWAVLIIGLLLVITGLIRYARPAVAA